MPAHALKINLLTQDEFSNSSLGKVMLWALSIGRYIVVFTELIVILSFLSRFKLDRDLTDLNEEIARQKAIILSYGDLEDRFRHVQEQLALVKAVRGERPPQEIFALLSQVTPPDIRFTDLAITSDELTLSATALSSNSFSEFVKRLHQSPLLTQINLSEILAEGGGTAINFSLTANRTISRGR